MICISHSVIWISRKISNPIDKPNVIEDIGTQKSNLICTKEMQQAAWEVIIVKLFRILHLGNLVKT